MKKTLIALTLALTVSLSFAQGTEEVCYDTAIAHVELMRFFKKEPRAFQEYLTKLSESSYPKRIKDKIKENAYWVRNNQDLPEDIFRKLAYVRCTMQSN